MLLSEIAAFWDGIQPRERPAAGLATAENSPASSEKVLATLEKRHETSILAVKTSRSCPRLTVCALYSRLCPGEDSTPYMCMLLCPRLSARALYSRLCPGERTAPLLYNIHVYMLLCPRLAVCALYSRLCPGEDSHPYMCMLLPSSPLRCVPYTVDSVQARTAPRTCVCCSVPASKESTV